MSLPSVENPSSMMMRKSPDLLSSSAMNYWFNSNAYILVTMHLFPLLHFYPRLQPWDLNWDMYMAQALKNCSSSSNEEWRLITTTIAERSPPHRYEWWIGEKISWPTVQRWSTFKVRTSHWHLLHNTRRNYCPIRISICNFWQNTDPRYLEYPNLLLAMLRVAATCTFGCIVEREDDDFWWRKLEDYYPLQRIIYFLTERYTIFIRWYKISEESLQIWKNLVSFSLYLETNFTFSKLCKENLYFNFLKEKK
jgi:hypothetical protein